MADPNDIRRMYASPFGSLQTGAAPIPQPNGGMDGAPSSLWSILAKALTPSRQGVAATLGAPVDGAAWIARKMGVPVPGDMREADPTVQANTGRALAWTPSASVPGSSQYFQNLMNDPPSINALAQTLRRRF